VIINYFLGVELMSVCELWWFVFSDFAC